MDLNWYKLTSDDLLMSFTFVSEGPKGRIEKVIQFTPIGNEGFYNLGFGDKDFHTGALNDEARTNNGDAEKVLATIVAALYTFCEAFPEAWVYATGSSSSRNRLYQIGINKYYDTARQDFEIYGQTDEEWERYEKGKNYDAFVIKRKNSTLEE